MLLLLFLKNQIILYLNLCGVINPIESKDQSVAWRPVCEGGLGMVDIYAYVKALKLMWIGNTLDSVHSFFSIPRF